MAYDNSKPDASGSPSSSSKPRYLDDRALEQETGGMLRRATLQKWRRTGQGPATYRIGRRVYYRLDEVLTWIESQRVAGSADGAES